MRDTQDILKELLESNLTDRQRSLVRELSNTLGGVSSQIKDEIIESIEIEAGKRTEMPVEEVKKAILLAGKQL